MMTRHRLPPRLMALLAGVLPLLLAAVIVLNLPNAAPEQEQGQGDEAQLVEPTGKNFTVQETAAVSPDPPPAGQKAASVDRDAQELSASFDPAQLSVQDLFEQLGDRARAGDVVAACELAHVVAECRIHLATYYHPASSPATGKELDGFIEREARHQEMIARLTRRCEGMNRTYQAEGALFTAHAGLAGHADSLVALTQLPQAAPAEFISNSQLIELYRSQLWPALRRALASNHPQLAATLMLQLASPMSSPVEGVMPDAYRNPQVAAAVFSQLSPEVHDLMIGRLYPPPTTEVLDTATVWIDELFGGQLPDVISMEQLMRHATPDRASSCADPEAWLDIR